jgi:alcohol dehydrogenase class IV
VIHTIGIPERLKATGVDESSLKACAEQSISDSSIIYNPKRISDPAEVLKIYQTAY